MARIRFLHVAFGRSGTAVGAAGPQAAVHEPECLYTALLTAGASQISPAGYSPRAC